MIEQMHTRPYVQNDAHIGGSRPKALVCTGPNMGGKSSAVKMVALLCLMSQIGSYVPASSMKLRTLDGIYTRMGGMSRFCFRPGSDQSAERVLIASDNLAKGKSTFMVEMTETSDILRSATERSLVILDELGRGTSTHDGVSDLTASRGSDDFLTSCRIDGHRVCRPTSPHPADKVQDAIHHSLPSHRIRTGAPLSEGVTELTYGISRVDSR